MRTWRRLGFAAMVFVSGAGCFANGVPPDVANVFVHYTAVSAGREHTCAIAGDKSVGCWGANSAGQYGDGTWSSDPVGAAASISDVTQIACGHLRTCAIRSNGELRCWGYGPLGDGSKTPANVPVIVPGILAISVATGRSNTCAVLQDHSVKCWGTGTSGQLGTGGNTNSDTPVAVSGITDALKVTVGEAHSCVLHQDGKVSCWGINSFGQSGGTAPGNTVASPTVVAGLNVVDLSAGLHHTCGLLRDGTVRCWGANWDGQLGIGTIDLDKHPTPTAVLSITSADAVAAGGDHTCVRLSNGKVNCWGRNDDGENGWGLVGMKPNEVPVAVTNLSAPRALATGVQHTCALNSSGALRCWGENEHGELADGTRADRAAPEP
jgi:alpha-tubulin suppressor-like RCC1 family protein